MLALLETMTALERLQSPGSFVMRVSAGASVIDGVATYDDQVSRRRHLASRRTTSHELRPFLRHGPSIWSDAELSSAVLKPSRFDVTHSLSVAADQPYTSCYWKKALA